MNTLFSLSGKTITTAMIIGLVPLSSAFAANTIVPLAPLLTTNNLVPAVVRVDPADEIKIYARRVLESAIPQFDERMLEAKGAEDWTKGLDFDRLTNAVGDGSVKLTDKLMQSKRASDETRALKLDPEKGVLRYENHARAWDFKQGPKLTKFETPERAAPIVSKALEALGLPKAEFGDAKLTTQMLRLSEKVQDPTNFGVDYEQYHLISLNRKINGFPVLNSRILASVNNDGLIQRLNVAWAPFKLNPNLKLRSRAEVLDQALEEVLQDDPLHVAEDSNVKITAQLAYANKGINVNDGKDETNTGPNSFRPVVVVSVLALPTPYQVIVPLAEEVGTSIR